MGHLTSTLYSAHLKGELPFPAQKPHLLTPTLIQAPRNKISGSPSNPSSPSSSSVQSVDMLFFLDFAMSLPSAVSFLFPLPSNQFRHHCISCGLLQGILCCSSFPTSTYCKWEKYCALPSSFPCLKVFHLYPLPTNYGLISLTYPLKVSVNSL